MSIERLNFAMSPFNAITQNASQGMTIPLVIGDLQDCKQAIPGRLVTMSRVRNRECFLGLRVGAFMCAVLL